MLWTRGQHQGGASPAPSRICTGENGGLDGGAVGSGLIEVDALVRFLAIEEIKRKLNDVTNASRITGAEDDFLNVLAGRFSNYGGPSKFSAGSGCYGRDKA